MLPQWKAAWADLGIAYRVGEDEAPALLAEARLAGATVAQPWPTRAMARALEARAAAEARRLAAPAGKAAAAAAAEEEEPAAAGTAEALILLLAGPPGGGAAAAAGGLVDAHRSTVHWLPAPDPAGAWCGAAPSNEEKGSRARYTRLGKSRPCWT